MSEFKTLETTLHYIEKGDKKAPVCVLWAHGWGQSHKSFLDMLPPLEKTARHILIDFPGFGDSALPPAHWGTAQYADFIATFIEEKIRAPVIWIGHSFGCRVGLQIASRHPDIISGMSLIAAAGLPRKRPLAQKLYFKGRIYTYKFLKKLLAFGLNEDWLKSKFGSRDYKTAGALRSLFIGVVNENLAPQAAQITCPVQLIYGTKDTETPPDIGERLQKLIKNADMVHLDGEDHYTVLSTGRHQVVKLLKDFIKQNGHSA